MNPFLLWWINVQIIMHTRAAEYFQKKLDVNKRRLRDALGALYEAKYGK